MFSSLHEPWWPQIHTQQDRLGLGRQNQGTSVVSLPASCAAVGARVSLSAKWRRESILQARSRVTTARSTGNLLGSTIQQLTSDKTPAGHSPQLPQSATPLSSMTQTAHSPRGGSEPTSCKKPAHHDSPLRPSTGRAPQCGPAESTVVLVHNLQLPKEGRPVAHTPMSPTAPGHSLQSPCQLTSCPL